MFFVLQVVDGDVAFSLSRVGVENDFYRSV